MKKFVLILLSVVISLAACTRPFASSEVYIPVMPTYDPSVDMPGLSGENAANSAGVDALTPLRPPDGVQPAPLGPVQAATDLPIGAAPTLTPYRPPTPPTGSVLASPTPDKPKTLPTLRTKEESYTVQPSDTLNLIARKYGVEVSAIMEANQLTNANLIAVGQKLSIPAPLVKARASAFKIIPDSELVLGPNTAGFSVQKFVASQKGYLASYEEKLDERNYSGAQVVERIAQEYSVNPRLLLSVLEFQSGWVTRSNPPENRRDYPLGRIEIFRKGLYRQLAWGANMLNRGYYLWRVNGIWSWQISDGTVAPAAPDINAGTAGVQHFFSYLYDRAGWDRAVSDKGLYATYTQFFGVPFSYAFEPIVPPNLSQPKLLLPFEAGTVWSFTGGPHGGWGDGSAWAALDFAPPGEGGGCRKSSEWVTAMAGGVITRSDLGAVVQDLDGDGDERTGWSILYMHIASAERVAAGTRLKAGEPIGHPSCEGGVSNGTHTHIARRYNGEWIAADGSIPFNLEGWISVGAGAEYCGYLKRNGQTLEAWDQKTDTNQIGR